MCGIFCLIEYQSSDILPVCHALNKLSARGPDNKSMLSFNYNQKTITFGFTRLAIMDLSMNGMQPFHDDERILVCNGEIYNFRSITKKYDLSTKTNNDCEVILPLYRKLGNFEELINNLDGEFALIIYDNNSIFAARDRYGVRPLYYGYNILNKTFGFASNLKSLHNQMNFVEQLKPNTFLKINLDKNFSLASLKFKTYYEYSSLIRTNYLNDVFFIKDSIRNLLTEAVRKRLFSDRKIGFLLSGGLDSSLIVSIATRILGPDNIVCFSIGLENSPDIIAAKKVTEYLGIKKHHIIIFDIEEGINNLSSVIEAIETYDVTTIRASVPQYLMAKYIREKTNVRVVLSGEGSDEIHGSYRYFRDAPSPDCFNKECIRLLEELCYFDNLRTDRTMASNGLEVRLPFLDFDYVNFIFKINPSLLMYRKYYIEKKIIRDSFVDYLPNEILYRSKEAFSDAVSNEKIVWADEIKKYAIKLGIDENNLKNNRIKLNKPMTLDAYLFRTIFYENYTYRDNVIPHYWMPRFQKEEILDPSAKVLKCYV
jgi:asparagine synthase (glutamine-hydrolysing)